MGGISKTPRNAAKVRQAPGGRRSSKAQVERRTFEVGKLLAEGATRAEIIEATQLPPRTTDDYVRRARTAWRADAAQDRETTRDRALARLLELRDRLLEARAWGPTVALEKLLLDVQGLRGPPGPEAVESATRVTPPALSLRSVKESSPLLISACARFALASDDPGLVEETRAALSRSLALFTRDSD